MSVKLEKKITKSNIKLKRKEKKNRKRKKENQILEAALVVEHNRPPRLLSSLAPKAGSSYTCANAASVLWMHLLDGCQGDTECILALSLVQLNHRRHGVWRWAFGTGLHQAGWASDPTCSPQCRIPEDTGERKTPMSQEMGPLHSVAGAFRTVKSGCLCGKPPSLSCFGRAAHKGNPETGNRVSPSPTDCFRWPTSG